MHAPERALSPRISALEAAVRVNGTAALASFWREIERTGAPLIEPAPGDAGHSLVTFIWRASGAERGVALLAGPLTPGQLEPLERLGSTDLFHLTCRVPNGLRNSYWFIADPPPSLNATSAEEWSRLRARRQVQGFLQPDPLNPGRRPYRTDPLDASTEFPGESVLELGDAPRLPPDYPRPDAPRGTLTGYRFASELLGNERWLWVYLPPGVETVDEPCDVLVVFDGQRSIDAMGVPATLDYLTSTGRLRPTVAVFVESPADTRFHELPCHEPFAEFLATELMPWLGDRYPVTNDPARTTLAGASYGGLAASFGALQHPERFGNVLSQSGSYFWEPLDRELRYIAPEERTGEWLTARFASAPTVPIRFYLDAGTLEDNRTSGISIVYSVRRFRDVLVERGYRVTHREFAGGHTYECWRFGFLDGLLSLAGADVRER